MRLGVLPMLVVVSMLVVGCANDDDKTDPKPFFPDGSDDDPRITVFDEAALEGPDGIERVLADDYKIPDIESIDCPADQEVKQGSSFNCTVVADGDELTVKISVTSDDGQYQVGLPE